MVTSPQSHLKDVTPVWIYETPQDFSKELRFLPVVTHYNTGTIRDDPYWTSRKNSLELMELSSLNLQSNIY